MHALAESRSLFVYGTLQPGHANAHRLESLGGTWRRASINGYLEPHGWTPGNGYPLLQLDPLGPQVRGFVFTSDALEARWPALDEFEGQDYRRVLAPVRLDDGATVVAFVYVDARGARRQDAARGS